MTCSQYHARFFSPQIKVDKKWWDSVPITWQNIVIPQVVIECMHAAYELFICDLMDCSNFALFIQPVRHGLLIVNMCH